MKANALVAVPSEMPEAEIVVEFDTRHMVKASGFVVQVKATGFVVRRDKSGEPVIVIKAGKKTVTLD